MIRIGLTGSIGMGKSAVAAMFTRLGIPVFDADAEVHRLQGYRGALLPEIEKRFPGSTGNNGVDRQKLAAMVFDKPTELRALERIVHPAVYNARQKFLKRHTSREMVVLDIPLLFEKAKTGSFKNRIDVTVTVSAPAWMQAKRVFRRPGMTQARFNAIKRIQMPDHRKRRLSDHVIATGCLKRQTFAQVRQLVACLARKKGR